MHNHGRVVTEGVRDNINDFWGWDGNMSYHVEGVIN